VIDKALENFDEFRSDGLKLLQVVQSQVAQTFFAIMREFYQDLAFVIRRSQTNEETAVDESVNQPDDAVVLQLHSLG
jgi:hypothetical protein